MQNRVDVSDTLQQISGRRKVPSIVIGSKPFGGCKELKAAQANE